ncbi:hypothetical protein D3C87_1585940 [compost metagenome]
MRSGKLFRMLWFRGCCRHFGILLDRFRRLIGHRRRSDSYLRLRRKRFRMLGLDLDDGRFQLVHLPPQHFLRRTRLHVLKLALDGTAGLFINPRARLGRVGRQTVNSAADHRYKISHQHFLMVAGIGRPNG